MILFNFFCCKSLVFVSKRAIERFAKKNKQFAHLLFYHEWPEQIAHSWAIFSQLLICPEGSEQIAQSHFLQWAFLSKWAMSEWANEQIPNPGIQ